MAEGRHSSYPSGERSGDERQGGTEALPRAEVSALLCDHVGDGYATIFSCGDPVVSLIAYDILQHAERHQSTRRVWDVIATDFYLYEANLWQNQEGLRAVRRQIIV